MRRRLAIAILLVVIGGCGHGGGPEQGVTIRSKPVQSRPGVPVSTVPVLLRFALPGVDGVGVQGADYSGKPLALWFWAPW